MSFPITVAYGNGIGPEIMKAVLNILEQAGAELLPEEIEIGETVYQQGISAGIEEKSWESLYKTKVFLKAPITTPQGGGFRSLNVAVRRKLGLYANIRPCVSYHPFVSTKHPKMDVIIIRENEEGLYTGMEYRHTQEVVECLKIISRSGSERINRFAFEYALQQNRKKVTCFTKDNIMKKTDGLFRKTFEQVGEHFPELQKEHWIVDIGAAKLADTPENFDVLVLPNLYGDILSDVAAQISGSVGMAGSANIGEENAMFEAIHGSAPRRAGQNMANPSGLLQAGVLMLRHIGQNKVAEKIQNAWLKTLEDGIHTYDIYDSKLSKKKVGTKEFAEAVVKRLGKNPSQLKPVFNKNVSSKSVGPSRKREQVLKEKKALVGVDVFLEAKDLETVKNALENLNSPLKLKFISNRGVNVWPDIPNKPLLSDLWLCRFLTDEKEENTTKENIKKKQTLSVHFEIIKLLTYLESQKIDFTKTENLYLFDQKPGFFSLD